MKKIFKYVVNAGSSIIVSPLIIMLKLYGLVCGKSDGLFWTFSQLLSLLPGSSGSYLRKNYYTFSMTRCSRDSAIMFGTIFAQADSEIGKGVYIGPNCNIGRSKIENHCTLGSNVHIISGKKQHHFEDLETPIQDQDGVLEKIVIGEDTWIGNGALVMANIGKKCIVGAGSVVICDVEDFSIIAGNPAKVIRKRHK